MSETHIIRNNISMSLKAVVCREVFVVSNSETLNAHAGKLTGDNCRLSMKFSRRSVLDNFEESVGGEIFTFPSPSMRFMAVKITPVSLFPALIAEFKVLM